MSFFTPKHLITLGGLIIAYVVPTILFEDEVVEYYTPEDPEPLEIDHEPEEETKIIETTEVSEEEQ